MLKIFVYWKISPLSCSSGPPLSWAIVLWLATVAAAVVCQLSVLSPGLREPPRSDVQAAEEW